jgi:hypothetical protein
MGSNLSGGKHKFKRWEYKRVGVWELGFGSWGIYRKKGGRGGGGSNVDGWMAKHCGQLTQLTGDRGWIWMSKAQDFKTLSTIDDNLRTDSLLPNLDV